jgi:hypothetical protein
MLQTKLVAAIMAAISWPSRPCHWVEFDRDLIPKLHDPLPVLALSAHTPISRDLLKKFVYASAPNATLTTDRKTGGQYAYDGDRLVALVDPTTGETRVFPTYGTLVPASEPINTDLAFQYVKETLPEDDTHISIVKGGSLYGTSKHREGDVSDPRLYLSHATVKRNITHGGERYPVCGPGSKVSFGFAADGEVRSFSYRWNPATLTGQVIKSNTTDIVYDSIVKQLIPFAEREGRARVDGVDI